MLSSHEPVLLPGLCEERVMNRDTLEGNWKQLSGKVKAQWGKLTDDDIDTIQGRTEELAGKIQERYGIAREEAERQVDEWQEFLDS
jgi:uncharacterized protein YjbJ (UPF0337 family)